jgi:hypothetical protein
MIRTVNHIGRGECLRGTVRLQQLDGRDRALRLYPAPDADHQGQRPAPGQDYQRHPAEA